MLDSVSGTQQLCWHVARQFHFQKQLYTIEFVFFFVVACQLFAPNVDYSTPPPRVPISRHYNFLFLFINKTIILLRKSYNLFNSFIEWRGGALNAPDNFRSFRAL